MKLKGSHKVVIFILVIIAVALWIVWLNLNAPYGAYAQYSISGEIISEHADPKDKPRFVELRKLSTALKL